MPREPGPCQGKACWRASRYSLGPCSSPSMMMLAMPLAIHCMRQLLSWRCHTTFLLSPSFTHTFACSFIHSFPQSSVPPFSHPFMHSLRSFIRSYIHACVLSFIQSKHSHVHFICASNHTHMHAFYHYAVYEFIHSTIRNQCIS